MRVGPLGLHMPTHNNNTVHIRPIGRELGADERVDMHTHTPIKTYVSHDCEQTASGLGVCVCTLAG